MHFLPNWRRITADPSILEAIQGYQLEFTSTPVQSKVRQPLQFSCAETEKIDREISALLEKEALHVVKPVSDQFISNLFLVPKRDGKSRPVINLKDLNTFLQYDHFKMEGIHLLRDLLQPHDWLGKIDLKDAYFVIPIWRNHRKYLRFLWKGTLLEFACLPFGLAVAPRLFTKVMKPVVALLRRAGIRLIIYLDDLLFMNQSQVGLEQDMATARYLLENLGFVVNFEKSYFVPTQQLEFLDFLVNSRDMTLLLPDCKVEAIKAHCLCLLTRQDVSVRELSHLIGKLTASIQAIFLAPLHYRSLQHLKHQALAQQNGFDASIALSSEAREELQWWLAHQDASTPSTRPRDRDQCFEEGLGGSMSGCENRETMVPDGAQTAHQLLGTVSRFICSEEFCEGSIMCPCETLHGQHFGCSLCKPSWGDKVPSSLQFGSGAMGMGSQAEYLCRTPCRTHERYGRLAVSSLPRFEQLAVMPRSLSGFDVDSRALCQGPLCRQTEYPVASVLQLEARSNGSRSGCPSTGLVEGKELCLPSVLLDHEGIGEVAGTRRGADTSHTVVAHTGLVSHPPGHVSVFTGPSAHEQQSPIRASRGDTPADFEQDSSVSRVACIKRSFQSKGICANASKLILAAWRPGTNAIYNSAWKKWHSWCLSRQVDSFRPTLADITGFLLGFFRRGFGVQNLEYLSFRLVWRSSTNRRVSRRPTPACCSFIKGCT